MINPAKAHLRLLLVLMLATNAFLLVVNPPAAHAAPPEVLASENPVVIAWGKDTKTIDLTWALEFGLSAATLSVTESGTPAPVLAVPVFSPPGTGTVPLTVTYGKTYTAQLL